MAKHEKEPQRTAGQKATHDAAVQTEMLKTNPWAKDFTPEPGQEEPTVAPDAAPPVSEGPEAWPVPSDLPGDGERVAGILREVGQVTDVGSLATVLRGVVNQAQKCRVQPDVLKGVLTP